MSAAGALVLVLLAAAGTAGAVAVTRLRCRGVTWPLERTAAAAGGLAVTCAAVVLPVSGALGPAGLHAAQHLLGGMVGPLLLALSAPVTLALRALAPRPRRVLLAVVRSRPAGVLTSPVVVVVLDAGGLAALYLTGLVGHSRHVPWVAAVVHLHLFVAGYLLAAVLAGPDPVPHRVGTAAALFLLVVVGATHQVVMTVAYAHALSAPAGPDGAAMAAASLMRTGGHLVDAALVAAVMARWYAATGRALARQRRRSARAGTVPA